MKPYHLFVMLYLLQVSWAHAEIYKRVDAEGHVTYSSEPIKGGKKLELKPLPTMTGGRSSRQSTPEDFPKVDTHTQKSRDATRRIILNDELATEEKLLDAERENLKTIENTPVPLIGPDGVPFRNAGRNAEKIKAAQDAIALHEQNIKALKTEISNLK
jgi:hypothetical protein